jgi:hypothetical protein
MTKQAAQSGAHLTSLLTPLHVDLRRYRAFFGRRLSSSLEVQCERRCQPQRVDVDGLQRAAEYLRDVCPSKAARSECSGNLNSVHYQEVACVGGSNKLAVGVR